MTNVKKYARKTALAVAALIAITVGSARLYAYGQSVGRADVAALDAGVDPVVAADHFVVAPAPMPAVASPPPSTPPNAMQSPGDAASGAFAWLKLSWVYAVLFAAGSVALALGAVWPSLRRGWKATAIGTFVAVVGTILGSKAAGISDAQAIYAAMSVVVTGVTWALRRNSSTIDLSTATPEQIADALAKTGSK